MMALVGIVSQLDRAPRIAASGLQTPANPRQAKAQPITPGLVAFPVARSVAAKVALLRKLGTASAAMTAPRTAAMSTRRLELALTGFARRPATCFFCQWRRGFTASAVRPAKPAAGTSMDPKASVAGAPIEAPRSYGKRVEGGFTPKPLPRPIGMPLPPNPGENTGLDRRTLGERRKDFVDYDKHLERRKELYVLPPTWFASGTGTVC